VSKIQAATSDQSFAPVQLEWNQSRRRSFATSFIFQIVALAILIRVAAYTPIQLARRPSQTVELVAPVFPVLHPKPIHVVAPRLPKPAPLELPKAQHIPELTAPPVVAKAEALKPLPQPKLEPPKVAMNPFSSAPVAPAPSAPKPAVKTDVFASAPPTKVTSALPPQRVQTGGFGDENGFKGRTTETAKLNAPKLGSFDAANGPGEGNGSGGSRGARGIVASAGFGSGVAAVPASTSMPGGGVRSGGFGDAHLATGRGGGQAKSTPSAMTPVEVLEKPQPVYTAEARNLKIEGEVHLKVVFQADGHVQVLQVVRGLGHGLDEAAMAAAQKIRFKPALREGRPCDMTATVHILFQLAS
jgi:TonB family protein